MKPCSSYTATFQRVEKKYLLHQDQYERLLPVILEHMSIDEYGKTKICNLYMDTQDDLLVRRSIEKPKYKEKMRLRSYGVPSDDSKVYLEIKKKVAGVVYKRRTSLTAAEAMAYFQDGVIGREMDQITSEIDAMKRRYDLYPKLYLAYDREAYREVEPSADMLRITMDASIRSREYGVDLRLGDAGELLLPADMHVMEVKTARAIPLWLCEALSRYHVYPTSFSKYGRIYQRRFEAKPTISRSNEYRSAAGNPTKQGGICHAYSSF